MATSTGKKILIDPDLKAKIIKARKLGFSYEACAEMTGVCANTIKAARDQDQDFNAKLNQAKESGAFQLVEQLFESANAEKLTMAKMRALELLLPAIDPRFKQGGAGVNITLNQYIAQQPEKVRKRLMNTINGRLE